MGTGVRIQGCVPNRSQERAEQVPPRGTRQDDEGGNEQTKFFNTAIVTGSKPVTIAVLKNQRGGPSA